MCVVVIGLLLSMLFFPPPGCQGQRRPRLLKYYSFLFPPTPTTILLACLFCLVKRKQKVMCPVQEWRKTLSVSAPAGRKSHPFRPHSKASRCSTASLHVRYITLANELYRSLYSIRRHLYFLPRYPWPSFHDIHSLLPSTLSPSCYSIVYDNAFNGD